MRIYEFAREKGLVSKEVVKKLQDAGFSVSNHMTVMSGEMIKLFSIGVPKSAEKVVKKDNVSPSLKDKASPPLLAQENMSHHSSQHRGKKEKEEIGVVPPLPFVDEEEDLLDDERYLVAGQTRNILFSSSREGEEEKKSGRVGLKGGRRRRKRPRVLEDHGVVGGPRKSVTSIEVMGEAPLFEVAERLDKESTELILYFLKKGMSIARNQMLSVELISEVARHFGIEVNKPGSSSQFIPVSRTATLSKVHRFPVVVVVGHIDHGKTTLLDYIRKSNVAPKEKGGITQHIGAYEVESLQGKIIFLDTPGHAAFSHMRGKGISVTDIVILMVAADDGVMPQTLEALQAARQLEVPIIVAINKIDKVGADSTALDEVKRQLAEQGLVPEEWGGSTIYVPISAKTGLGVENLLEMIVLQSQLMDLAADPTVPAKAFVLESRIDRGCGPMATVITIEGVLKKGDYFICGGATGRVRTLTNSKGELVLEAKPSVPVQVSGFNSHTGLGDWLEVVSAEEYLKKRNEKTAVFSGAFSGARQGQGAASMQAVQQAAEETIRLLVKVDTQGSALAISALIKDLIKANKEASKRLQLVSVSVGDISEKDVIKAQDMAGIVLGLHVSVEKNASVYAKRHGVDIVTQEVIYHLDEYLKELLDKTKKIEYVLKEVGEATVVKVFPIKGGEVIAGCRVKSGLVPKNGEVVCTRQKREVGRALIKSLQRERKSVKEVHAGHECGLITDSFHDWQEGDNVTVYLKVPAGQ